MEEIAKELNLPVEKIIEANRTAADTLSLDTPVGDEEDTTIGSFVEDDNTPGPADATSNALLAEALSEILGTLTDREADVLRMRFRNVRRPDAHAGRNRPDFWRHPGTDPPN